MAREMPQNTTKQANKRNNTTWRKGMPSPNPAGRPGGYQEFRELCRGHTPEAVQTLVTALANGDTAAVSAARVLLEYGWGKPSSAPEDIEAAKAAVSPLVGLTVEQLMALASGGDDDEE